MIFRVTIVFDLSELPFFQTGHHPIVLVALNIFGGFLMGPGLGPADIYVIQSIKAKHSFCYYLHRKSLIYIISIVSVLIIIFGISMVFLNIPIGMAQKSFSYQKPDFILNFFYAGQCSYRLYRTDK
jgi:hypothetical protein